MLFLANMLSKMKHDTPLGSRIAEVHNGSSLFTGDAGQGESNIRRWIIENDWLEAIVALPLNMFYNTGIATYIWVLTNRKPEHRQGKVQLIDATQWFKPLRKNLGKKNCELSDEDIQRICDTFLAFKETEQSKIFPNAAFGYWKVKVERPLRLHSQLTRQRIETLRFASGDEEIRAALYEKLGDDLFEKPQAVRDELEKLVAAWGDDEAEDEEDNGDGDAKKGLSEKTKKKLLDADTWRRDATLVATATQLREALGDGLFTDHNVFLEQVDAALKKLGIKPSAADLKIIVAAVSWRDEARRARHQESPQVRQGPARPAARPLSQPGGRPKARASNTSPTASCATSSRSRCWRRAASRPSSAARSCPTRPTPGSSRPTPRSAMKSASPATSTSRRNSAPSPRSAPTSSSWNRKPRACSPRSRRERRHEPTVPPPRNLRRCDARSSETPARPEVAA